MFNFLKKRTGFGAVQSILIDHLTQLEEKKDSIPDDVFDVTKFTLEEILSIFGSMDILMKKNDFDGCIKLSRSILENSINLQYIYKEDTEKRAKNFKLSSLKGMTRKFEALDEYTPEAKEMYEFFQKELEGYEREKNVRDKFKAVDSDATYVRSYRRLSEFVHPVYRHERIDFTEDRPFVLELKRTVRSDTGLVTLMALKRVCTKYDLDGGVVRIDDPEYKGIVFFATNPKRQEEVMKDMFPKKDTRL